MTNGIELSRVLQNSYTTALILEDDADWDVALKMQLREFARGVRLLNGEENAPKTAPYGTDWDILWIGGCASGPGANETTFFAIPDDPTVPSPDKRDGWGGPLETWKQQYPNLPIGTTRFLYRAEMGCCTYGYAVTREGAKKILAALSVDRLDCAVDNAMSDLCAGTNGRRQLKCFATFPNLIGTYDTLVRHHATPISTVAMMPHGMKLKHGIWSTARGSTSISWWRAKGRYIRNTRMKNQAP